MRCAFIERHEQVWPITTQCRVLAVSASGYHQHRARSEAPDQPGRIRDMALLVHIRAVFIEMKGADGWPRIWREFGARGIHVGKERVRKLMKAYGLQARGKRKFKVTTNSNHALPVSPDLLERNFSAPEPNRVWTGDITYVQTDEGWLYLAVVIDLFSRQIVGFAMHERMMRNLDTSKNLSPNRLAIDSLGPVTRGCGYGAAGSGFL